MAGLGQGLLALALAVSLFGIGASVVGARRADARGAALAAAGRRAIYVVALLTTACFVLVEVAFYRTDLTFAVVAEHSSSTTPLGYRLAAVWSSQEGSLLLWVWLLSLWSALILGRIGVRAGEATRWAQAVLLGLGAFFLLLMTFWVSPFERLDPAPFEGAGLNPLLQYPSMMIHPPMLYSGYTLFAVPFAFAVGALAAGDVGSDWIRRTRRFTLAAWLLLGIGIVLGSRWSYAELGWGGYWGWDAVENASLMPWIVGTAFLHSVMIQEKRGMLRTWNVSLILATGILCILGTFIVRSGVLTSIHAFGASTVGTQFLLLLGVMTAGSFALVVWRRDLLRSEHRIDSLLSREAIFLAGNVVLVLLCFVVLWGTFWPLIAEIITGQQRPLSSGTWGWWVGPLALLLVALMALGPLAAWRRTTASRAWSQVRAPLAVAVVILGGALVLGVGGSAVATVAVLGAGFVLGAVGQEVVRGTRVRRRGTGEAPPLALIRLVLRNRRRHGGYIVHVGFAIVVASVAVSSVFKDLHREHADLGARMTVGPYELRYVDAIGETVLHDGRIRKIVLGAVVDVYEDGRKVRTIRPTREYFPTNDTAEGPVGRFFLGESATEVALQPGWTRDLWVAMQPDGDALAELILDVDKRLLNQRAPFAQGEIAAAGLAEVYRRGPPPVTFQIILSPMVTWLWIGTLIMALGALLALVPGRDPDARRLRARTTARVARELRDGPTGAADDVADADPDPDPDPAVAGSAR